jgi:O-antigen/teichoic acid export membrane protein
MRRVLLGETSVVFGGYVVQLVLTFVTGILIARLLGPDGYGVLNILRGLFMTVAIFTQLGLEVALLRVCGVRSASDPETVHLLLRLRLLTSAINFAAFFIAMAAEALFLGKFYDFANFGLLFGMTMIALPLQADMHIVSAIYKSYGEARVYALLTNYLQSLFRIVAIGILFVAGGDIKTVVIINGLQIALSSVALSLYTRFSSAGLPRLGALESRLSVLKDLIFGSWSEVRKVLHFSLWMTVSAFVMGVMRSADTLVLGGFAPASEIGAYAALNSVAQLVQMFPMAASQSLGPNVARFHSEGDIPAIKDAMGRYIHQAAIVSAFIFSGIAVFGQDLWLVFGHKFVFDPVVCFILPLSYVFSATLAPTGFALSMTGRHRVEFLILVFGCAVLVGLCWLLIPRYGQVGAASAVAIGFAATNLIRFAYDSRVLGFIPGHVRDIAPIVVAFVVAYSSRAAELKLVDVTLITTLVACVAYTAVFGVVVYFALLRLDYSPFARRSR